MQARHVGHVRHHVGHVNEGTTRARKIRNGTQGTYSARVHSAFRTQSHVRHAI